VLDLHYEQPMMEVKVRLMGERRRRGSRRQGRSSKRTQRKWGQGKR